MNILRDYYLMSSKTLPINGSYFNHAFELLLKIFFELGGGALLGLFAYFNLVKDKFFISIFFEIIST